MMRFNEFAYGSLNSTNDSIVNTCRFTNKTRAEKPCSLNESHSIAYTQCLEKTYGIP